MAFPTSPTNGQIYKNKIWNSTSGVWKDIDVSTKANLDSPTLTGTPAAPTAAVGTNTTQIATTAFVNAEIAAQVPVGTVSAFAGATAPSTYLICNGAQVSRADYSELFTTIGTVYGAGDGSTTFNLPDMRESSIVGVGTYSAVAGTTHGSLTAHDAFNLGEFKNDQMQGHWHNLNGYARAGLNLGGPAPFSEGDTQRGPYSNDTYVRHPTTDSVHGYGMPRTGATTRGKGIGMNYIIKARRW